MKYHFLITKTVFFTTLSVAVMSIPAQAGGIPTFDGATVAAIGATLDKMKNQYDKQIDQFKKQKQQYELQLKNSVAPTAYMWNEAQATISNILQATNTLEHYKNQLGDIDSYLHKFQDVAYYKTSPCFSSTGCSEAEWKNMQKNQEVASESQKQANYALFKSIDQQQSNLKNDSRKLVRLQSNAKSAEGQMEALGHANMLASAQINQLLQIRSLLIAQQNLLATRMQATTDKEAKAQAAAIQLRQGSYQTSPARTW